MDKLKMQTPNLVDDNIDKIAEIFPNCITEDRDKKGNVRRAVDFDLLHQELSNHLVEGPRERYTLNWPGKNEAMLAANTPIAKTLRPCEEESINFETTQNLFIEGDNLDVLKLLQETYLNKIKMIYIDPPYNTGKDFIYRDNFAEDKKSFEIRTEQKDDEGNRLLQNLESNGRFHSDWLCMMYPRLKLARNLLKEDGVIFISIDDNEVANLRKLCDEVFGEKNFVADIIWHKKYAASNDAKGIATMHDHILMYQKTVLFNRNLLPRTDKQNSLYKYDSNDGKGSWRPDNLSVKTISESYLFEIINPNTKKAYSPPKGRCWLTNAKKIKDWITEGRIFFGKDGNGAPQLKRYLNEVQQGIVPTSYWSYDEVGHTDSSRKELKDLFEGNAPFDNPKPTKLISRSIQISTNINDIILDFFAGSCTTAHAVMKLNAEDRGKRKFIMVQLPEPCDEKFEAFKAGYKTIAEIGKERMRRAGHKIKAELKQKQPKQSRQLNILDENTSVSSVVKNLDIGFRVFKVESSNMRDVYYIPDEMKQGQLAAHANNIKDDRKPEDLLFQVFLDWGLELTLPVVKETIEGKTVFFVDGNVLAACFNFEITEDLIKILAKRKPLRAVFRDDAYGSDSVKINVEQIFKLISPTTEVKSL